MGLSYQSFRKAKEILEEVAQVGDSFLPGYLAETKADVWKPHRLIWEGELSNGGKEQVWTIIENPTKKQFEIFERRKKEVPNSHMVQREGTMVMFGWF